MRLIDLSQPLYDGSPNCPAHPPVRISVMESHASGAAETWHIEDLHFASHTGSHVDAPLHKIPGGASLDQVPLERWQGPAHIVDMRGILPRQGITAAMLEAKVPASTSIRDVFLLLATGWGQKRAKTQEWLHDAPVLAADGARWLIARGARGVGIDHYSIGDGTTHAILLSHPVLIVEELHFPEEVFAMKGPLEFWALPLNMRAHSGAPCRPVLAVRDVR